MAAVLANRRRLRSRLHREHRLSHDAERNGGGYVGIIGVRRGRRGRGLAKALLLRTFGEFWRRGVTRVSLDVDADSPTGATRLYESVGMHVEGAMAVYER